MQCSHNQTVLIQKLNSYTFIFIGSLACIFENHLSSSAIFVAGTRKQVEEEGKRVLAEDSDDSVDNEVLNFVSTFSFYTTFLHRAKTM